MQNHRVRISDSTDTNPTRQRGLQRPSLTRRVSANRQSAIRNRRGGTAAVELAIVLPLLLLLVFGCVDFGRVAYYSMALKNAVGCGAQYAATHRFTEYSSEAWQQRVQESVTQEIQNIPDFDRDSLNITISIDENTPAAVRVTVGATYPFQTIVDWPGLPKHVPLRHRVTVRQYQ